MWDLQCHINWDTRKVGLMSTVFYNVIGLKQAGQQIAEKLFLQSKLISNYCTEMKSWFGISHEMFAIYDAYR